MVILFLHNNINVALSAVSPFFIFIKTTTFIAEHETGLSVWKHRFSEGENEIQRRRKSLVAGRLAAKR
jgi:hypothetical protein